MPVNVLAQLYRNSGILSTDVPDVDTGIGLIDLLRICSNVKHIADLRCIAGLTLMRILR